MSILAMHYGFTYGKYGTIKHGHKLLIYQGKIESNTRLKSLTKNHAAVHQVQGHLKPQGTPQ